MEQFLIINNIIAAQSKYIVPIFESILSDFSTIIEIGFDRGGFSIWLNQNKKNTTKLVSYDITFDRKQSNDTSIDFRLGNCFSENIISDIRGLIESPGKTLVLCDGGNKEQEFILYSQFLKTGDVIMLHDYEHSATDYQSICKQIGWQTAAESRYENIKESVELNNLIPYNYDEFKSVLWGAFQKSKK